MAKHKGQIELDVQDGYEPTWEYRKVRKGEWHSCGGEAVLWTLDEPSCSMYPILRPIAPKFKPGRWVAYPSTGALWKLDDAYPNTAADGCNATEPFKGRTVFRMADPEGWQLWTPAIGDPVGHDRTKLPLGKVKAINGDKYTTEVGVFALAELCPGEAAMKWPVYCTSICPDVNAAIRINSLTQTTEFRVDGSTRECLGAADVSRDMIRGDRQLLTEAEALARVKPKPEVVCPRCGWAGSIRELGTRNLDGRSGGSALVCPQCSSRGWDFQITRNIQAQTAE